MNEDWIDIASFADRQSGCEVQLNVRSLSSEMRHRKLGAVAWLQGKPPDAEKLTLDDEQQEASMREGSTVVYKGKEVLIERIHDIPMAIIRTKKGKTKMVPWMALIASYLESPKKKSD